MATKEAVIIIKMEWSKETPDEMVICESCKDGIFGHGYRLIYVTDRLIKSPSDIWLCQSCNDAIK